MLLVVTQLLYMLFWNITGLFCPLNPEKVHGREVCNADVGRQIH